MEEKKGKEGEKGGWGVNFLFGCRKKREKIVKLEQSLSKYTEISISKNRKIDGMGENPFQMFV